ncbi:MAG: hypothetical protein RMK79_10455 [Anaerolineae bacterium]|nr:hypothetical protein [Anaerolineae bacterium]
MRTLPEEVARTWLIRMRRGSLSAAEEISGHQYETGGRWLRAAAQHAPVIRAVFVRDLRLSAVEVDAFWSFVKKVCLPWSGGRHGRRRERVLRVSDPGPAQALRGGVDFWGFGRRRCSQGRAPDAAAHGGAAGYPVGA